MNSDEEQLSIFDWVTPKVSLGGCNGCICNDCMKYWQGKCPYGSCFDDKRSKSMPYTTTHPGVIRRFWSEWNKPGEQCHWCRGGVFYPTTMCYRFVQYQKPQVKTCLEANVLVWPDGYIDCSLVDTVGCVECMKRFESKQH